ncbi:MAG: hypothetical protein JXA44_05330, partial [Methanospirillaceae archaeon]|nr:hypothetical protein [Methanospirillaceae archaeon]
LNTRPIRLGQETKIVTILPTDWSGKFSSDKEILIIPRSIVMQTINTCVQHQKELYNYCKTIIEQSISPCYILVLTNLSECGYMYPDLELNMYEEIICTNIPKGSTIFIKQHPFSLSPLGEKLLKTMNDYRVQLFPEEFRKYPIELMQPVFNHCQVIAFSATILSITYLFGQKVINPMNNHLMKNYFPESTWYLIEDTQNFLTSTIRNLTYWDHKSIIWSREGNETYLLQNN